MKSYACLPVATLSLVLMCHACSSENSGRAREAHEATGGRLSSSGNDASGGRLGSSASSGSLSVPSSAASVDGGGGGTASPSSQVEPPSDGGAASTGIGRTSGGAVGEGTRPSSDSPNTGGVSGFSNGGVSASTSTGGQSTTTGVAGSSAPATTGPCDIFKSAGTPCVAAHSTVRALFGAYSGKLYQVRRTDNTTKEIAALSPGGFADGPSQDTFCSGSTCVITVVYDQSGKGNDLWYQGSAEVPGSPKSSAAKAATESLTVSGHKVYSLYINPGNSYWRDGHQTGVPIGSDPEGMYMVTSGTHVNGGCCFDYGNSETTRKADAAGAMDAINFSTQCWFGGCSGKGPWVQADLEWGLFPGGSSAWNPNQQAFANPYVTAMLKNNGKTEFAIKGGNAQSGDLVTLYQGKLPNGYSPMKKQGAIVLGSGGDCCKPDGGANLSAGTFYEGAIVSGYPTDTTDDLVQSNIVSAGYGSTVISNP